MNDAAGSGSHPCPACGFPLDFAPWKGESPADEICPSCGIQFGYDDFAGGNQGQREKVYIDCRAQWIRAGMPWFSSGQEVPAGWNPRRQLQAAGLGIEGKRSSGGRSDVAEIDP